jgi:hypothetical protein
MNQTYVDLLDFIPEPEDDIDDESSPLWVRFSLDELETELNWLNRFGHVVPELHTHAQRWIYALKVLHNNKARRYQWRLNAQHNRRNQAGGTREPMYDPICPHKDESRIWNTLHRNCLGTSEELGDDDDDSESDSEYPFDSALEELASDEEGIQDQFIAESSGSESPLPREVPHTLEAPGPFQATGPLQDYGPPQAPGPQKRDIAKPTTTGKTKPRPYRYRPRAPDHANAGPDPDKRPAQPLTIQRLAELCGTSEWHMLKKITQGGYVLCAHCNAAQWRVGTRKTSVFHLQMKSKD